MDEKSDENVVATQAKSDDELVEREAGRRLSDDKSRKNYMFLREMWPVFRYRPNPTEVEEWYRNRFPKGIERSYSDLIRLVAENPYFEEFRRWQNKVDGIADCNLAFRQVAREDEVSERRQSRMRLLVARDKEWGRGGRR